MAYNWHCRKPKKFKERFYCQQIIIKKNIGNKKEIDAAWKIMRAGMIN